MLRRELMFNEHDFFSKFLISLNLHSIFPRYFGFSGNFYIFIFQPHTHTHIMILLKQSARTVAVITTTDHQHTTNTSTWNRWKGPKMYPGYGGSQASVETPMGATSIYGALRQIYPDQLNPLQVRIYTFKSNTYTQITIELT